jgi:hypothetical protein
LNNSAKSKIDLLPNNSSSFQGAAREAGVAGPLPVRSSSGLLVGELATGSRIRGAMARGHKKTARGSASEPSWNSALVLGRPGVHPVSSVYRIDAASRRIGSSAVNVAVGSEMVETRRLELLTLSLQRRCSAN